MINTKRLVDDFLELASLDSPSLDERRVADAIKSKAYELGLEVYEDKGGQKYGGNTGNLYITVKGLPDIQPVLLMAHMDTVTPCLNKQIVVDGDIIKTDGTTILGGDDLSGVVEILEAIRILKENDLPHGDIEVLFTFGEELSLCGSKVVEYDRIRSKIALVLDANGPIGTAANSGPAQYQLMANIKGKLAHAGIEPEKGINAITLASKAISAMKLGRIDFETTANVGVIKGGQATNIVCGHCEVHLEARSRNTDKLEKQVQHMVSVLENTVAEGGGELDLKLDFLYPSFNVSEDEYIVKLFKKACRQVGVEPILEATGGGSDTNIISGKGIKALDISCGMTDVHTTKENIKISDMVKATELVVNFIQLMVQEGE